jgi:threonine aldolase
VWPTAERRNATGDELRAFDEQFGTLMLELPLRDAGFVLPSWEELTDLVAAARERGAAVHFDGARLWESVHHLGHRLAEVAGLADSVYVSCYKTLGAVSGAVLAGDEAFVRETKVWRHRYGGRLWQQWPAVLSALVGLDRELPRVGEYVGHAKQVAAALAEVPGARVYPQPPHTHQFQLWLPHSAEALNAAGLRLAEEHGTGLFGYWWEPGLPGLGMTEVTVAAPALDWTSKEIAEAMTLFLDALPE